MFYLFCIEMWFFSFVVQKKSEKFSLIIFRLRNTMATIQIPPVRKRKDWV